MKTPVIFYDGHCALCSASVQAVLRIDDAGVFRFAPLQSEFAKTQLAGADPGLLDLDSIIVLDGDALYTKSEGFFHIMRRVGWPYRALNVMRILPLRLRDWVYDWVARNRYAIFGQHTSCWMPQAEWKGRFIE